MGSASDWVGNVCDHPLLEGFSAIETPDSWNMDFKDLSS